MPRKKIDVRIKNYGLYSQWDRSSKELPKLIKHTTQIEACLGVEFGMTLHVLRGKGEMLDFTIHHPPFVDADGAIAPPFTGSYFIHSNDFLFFLGDTVWEPIEDKRGEWLLQVELKGVVVARKLFTLV